MAARGAPPAAVRLRLRLLGGRRSHRSRICTPASESGWADQVQRFPVERPKRLLRPHRSLTT
eukprot:2056764-Rhodomonas_salina.2